MSLFSRIDRIRTNGRGAAESADEGVFAIPSLGTGSGASVPPPVSSKAEPMRAPEARAVKDPVAAPAPRPFAAPSERPLPLPSASDPFKRPSPLALARPSDGEASSKRLSPLERMARRTEADDDGAAAPDVAPQQPAPIALAPIASTPVASAPVPSAPVASAERLQPDLSPEVAAPRENGATPFRLPAMLRDTKAREDAAPLPAVAAPREHSQAPLEMASALEAPADANVTNPSIVPEITPFAASAPTSPDASGDPAPPSSGGTAFDRLMAARAKTESRPNGETPRSGAPTLTERLSAMRAVAESSALSKGVSPEDANGSAAYDAPETAPAASVVEPSGVVFDLDARLEDVLAPIPDEAPAAELATAKLPADESSGNARGLPVALPVSNLDVPTSDADEATLEARGAADSLASAPPAFVPVELPPVVAQPVAAREDAAPAAPPLPWETPSQTPASPGLNGRFASETPEVAPVAAPASPWAQRLAGRDALRDVPLAPNGNGNGRAPLDPAPAPNDEPTEALDRAPGGLARTGGEGVAGEAEARNRAIYRQKHFVFDAVLGSLDGRALQNPTRDSVKAPIERAVDSAIREFNLSLDNSDRSWMIEEFVREVTDLGPLVGLLDEVTVNKILVVGSTDVAVERFGRIERTGVSFRDDDHLLSVVRRIADLTGGRIDAKVPLLDRPLPDNARIRAKIPPLAPQPTLTVEKSTGNPFTALKRQIAERGRENALPYAQLRERIQQRLLREFEGNAAALANPERLRSQVEEMIGLVIAEEKVAVSRAERASLVMDLLNEIVGLGPIEPLLNDPDVDEVMVNGPFQIYVERKGKLEIAPQRFRDNAHVMQVIERIVAPLGRRIDEKSPMVDGRLRDGSRFNAIIPPLSLSGPSMTIRKFARDPFTMTDLINFGSLSREAAQFLQAAVEGRMNIIVSGGTGSGKTTTLNVLSSFIPASERIVTIEDAAELQLRQEHVIRLETRPANIEGSGEITIRDLVRNCLRMRPDRIVVGECRGGEALDMLQAMNTGHDGSLTTGHSNGPRDTVKRLETMVMMAGFDLPIRAIREQISMAIQYVVHQERMRDGKRRVTAITELVGMEGDVVTMQDIFRFEQERVDDEGRIVGSLAATGLRPQNFDNIVDNGVNLSMDLFQPRNMGGRDGDLRSRLDQRVNGR